MEYEDFNPWQTKIRKYKISDEVCAEIINEYASIGSPPISIVNGDEFNRLEMGEYYKLHELLSEHITPKVLQYAKDIFDPNCHVKEISLFFQYITTPVSDGIECHDHVNGHIVSTLYLNNPSGSVSFLDPRGSCRRGYPEKITKTYFKKLTLTPENGDLNIFPSFLWHEGGLITEPNRMVMIVDYWIGV